MFSKLTSLPRWQLVIQGFFDDSGKEGQADSRFVCLAGYLAPQDCWTPFMNKWAHLLAFYGIEEFHMKEMRGIQRKKDWDDAKLSAVIADFVDAIREGKLIGLGVSIDADIWSGLPRDLRKKYGTAQEFAMQRIMRITVDKLDAVGIGHPINLVFDQDEEFCSPRLQRYFAAKRIWAPLKKRVPAISFASAHSCHPLQAADLLAAETRRATIAREDGKRPSEHIIRLLTPLEGLELHYEHEFWGKNAEERLTHGLDDYFKGDTLVRK